MCNRRVSYLAHVDKGFEVGLQFDEDSEWAHFNDASAYVHPGSIIEDHTIVPMGSLMVDTVILIEQGQQFLNFPDVGSDP
jgi:hypothetical protein